MSESRLIKDILMWSTIRPDLTLWRQNTGAAVTKHGALVRFGVKGQADISGIRDGGQRIEIECKAGTKQTDAQRAWQRMIERHGGVYVLARSVEDVKDALTPPGAEMPL